MSKNTDPVALGLAGVLAVDAVAGAVPVRPIEAALDRVDCPAGLRPWLAAAKLGAAGALVGGRSDPRTRTLAGFGMIAYFLGAIGFHIRAHDRVANAVPAVGMLAWAVAVVARSRR